MGQLSISEKRVLAIFSSTALLWIFKDLLNQSQTIIKLDDTMIALIGAITLFMCPSGNQQHPDNLSETDEHDFHGSLLEWGDTKKMAWGILLLFGGGLALAGALEKAGLIQQLGEWLSHFAGGGFILVLMVTVDRKSTRLNSSHIQKSRMPSSA